jgi:hypothetical protein
MLSTERWTCRPLIRFPKTHPLLDGKGPRPADTDENTPVKEEP